MKVYLTLELECVSAPGESAERAAQAIREDLEGLVMDYRVTPVDGPDGSWRGARYAWKGVSVLPGGTLYAVCWQDPSEPWGWAPVTGENAEPGGSYFFWERAAAEAALETLILALVPATVPALMYSDRRALRRHEEEERRREVGGPGVSIHFIGQDGEREPAPPPEPPRLRTEDELRRDAREELRREYSVQTYQVPRP